MRVNITGIMSQMVHIYMIKLRSCGHFIALEENPAFLLLYLDLCSILNVCIFKMQENCVTDTLRTAASL